MKGLDALIVRKLKIILEDHGWKLERGGITFPFSLYKKENEFEFIKVPSPTLGDNVFFELIDDAVNTLSASERIRKSDLKKELFF